MKIGAAIALLEAGKRVARAGWNGKGMWLALQRPDTNSKMTLPYIYMKTADDKLVPWLASQTDILADDWVCLEDIETPQWCYSTNEEEYYGRCASRDEALTELAATLEGHLIDNAQCVMTGWIGRCKEAFGMLRKSWHEAEYVVERANEFLADNIGGDEDPIDLDKKYHNALDATIIAFLEQHVTHTRYGVDDAEAVRIEFRHHEGRVQWRELPKGP